MADVIPYLDYPKASIVRVVHPGQQYVGHRWNNVGWGIPRALLGRYWREANPNTTPPTPEWWLPPEDAAWGELLPYIEALRLYDPPGKSPAVLAADLAADRRRVAIEQYWSRVRALPGGTDPLWRYGSQSAEDVDDMRWMLRDDSRPQRKPWFPRVQLRIKYGTTSLQEYAAQHGVHYPD